MRRRKILVDSRRPQKVLTFHILLEQFEIQITRGQSGHFHCRWNTKCRNRLQKKKQNEQIIWEPNSNMTIACPDQKCKIPNHLQTKKQDEQIIWTPNAKWAVTQKTYLHWTFSEPTIHLKCLALVVHVNVVDKRSARRKCSWTIIWEWFPEEKSRKKPMKKKKKGNRTLSMASWIKEGGKGESDFLKKKRKEKDLWEWLLEEKREKIELWEWFPEYEKKEK